MKTNWKTFSLAFAIILICLLGIWYVHVEIKELSINIVKEHELNEVNRKVMEIENNLNSNILRSLESVVVMPSLLNALEERNPGYVEEVFDTLVGTYHQAVVYLMDSAGLVIAGTPFNSDGETFIGNNYSFRPYFSKAREMKSVIYPAVGVTSGKRGLYFSKAVYNGGVFKGVLVIKIAADGIERKLTDHGDTEITVLTSDGVVFLSSKRDYLYRFDKTMNDCNYVKILENKQFPEEQLKPLGYFTEEGRLEIDNRSHYFRYIDLNIEGWRILYFRDEATYSMRGAEVALIGFISFILLIMLLVIYFMISMVQKKKKSEKGLRKFKFVIEQCPISVLITDLKGKIEYVNRNFLLASGYSRKEILGKNSAFLKSGFHDKEFYQNMWKHILEGERWTGEVCNANKNGDLFWESMTIYPLEDEKREIANFIAIKEDITDRKKNLEELKHYASIDAMTSLYNRRTGLLLCEKHYSLARREGDCFSLCFADINNLKIINDSLGHECGDRLIVEVAKILKGTTRESDILCRLGGDEFLMLFPRQSIRDTKNIEKRLQKRISQFNLHSTDFEISISMGFVEFDPLLKKNLHELISEADDLMYKNKQELKRRIAVGSDQTCIRDLNAEDA